MSSLATRRLAAVLTVALLGGLLVVPDAQPADAQVVSYSVEFSTSANRSNPQGLAGATVSGNVYVFTTPDTSDITTVRFWVDNPNHTGSPLKSESNAPYDLAGGTVATANPYNTATLGNGAHSVTVQIVFTGGSSQFITANFTVSNGGPTTTTTTTQPTTTTTTQPTTTTTQPGGYSLRYSTSSNRSNPQTLEGATASGNIYVFTSPDTNVTTVRFWIDNPNHTGNPNRTETNAPYDLAGGTATTANPFNTATLADGAHTITAEIVTGATSQFITANYTTQNGAPAGCSTTQPVTTGPLPIVTLPFSLTFSGSEGGVCDAGSDGTGLPYVWPKASGDPYLRPNLDVTGGELRITTTAGLATTTSNSQDNSLGVGVDPGQSFVASTVINNLPAGTGGSEQAGLWFGTHRFGQDWYAKLVVVSRPAGQGGLGVQLLVESNGATAASTTVNLANPGTSPVELEMTADAAAGTVAARYRVGSGNFISVGNPLAVDARLFTSDQAGVDGELGTDSFIGLYGSHRNAANPLVYRFASFNLSALTSPPPPPPPPGQIAFDGVQTTIDYKPTAMTLGPDGRLYVLDAVGPVHAYPVNANGTLGNEVQYDVLPASPSGIWTALGLAFDPSSTAQNMTVWISHSITGGENFSEGVANSSRVTRVANLTGASPQVTEMISGLPRAIANHAINSIHFDPVDPTWLYIAIAGETGAGGPNNTPTEFGTRPEQPLSSALLKAQVRSGSWSPANDGNCASSVNDSNGTASKTVPATCSVQFVATGLRNTYDFVFATDGMIYGNDNALGVAGTVPLEPSPDCQGIVNYGSGSFDPGEQPDKLQRIDPNPAVTYYGHPNPARDQCVFYSGSFQSALFGTTVTPPSNYQPALRNMNSPGTQQARSFNGIMQYKANTFGGALQGQLILTAFSGAQTNQGLHRITTAATSGPTRIPVTVGGNAYTFNQPLPLVELSDGRIVVGEFRGRTTQGGRILVLAPVSSGSGGSWATRAALPQATLDAGSDAVGGLLYVMGGKSSASNRLTTVRSYNPSTNSWSTLSQDPLPGTAREDVAAAAHNGLIYVFGGATANAFIANTTTAAVFNPGAAAGSRWNDGAVADLPAPVTGAAAISWNGLIWIVGGLNGSGNSIATVRTYDPATNTYGTGPSLPSSRDNAGVAVVNGHLYAFGGRNRQGGSGDSQTTVWRLQTPGGSWEQRASLPSARRAFVVGTAAGKVQLFGGESSATAAFTAVHEYDPTSNAWTTLTAMPTGRHGPAGATINGITYVAGGATTSGAGSATTVNQAFTR